MVGVAVVDGSEAPWGGEIPQRARTKDQAGSGGWSTCRGPRYHVGGKRGANAREENRACETKHRNAGLRTTAGRRAATAANGGSC